MHNGYLGKINSNYIGVTYKNIYLYTPSSSVLSLATSSTILFLNSSTDCCSVTLVLKYFVNSDSIKK